MCMYVCVGETSKLTVSQEATSSGGVNPMAVGNYDHPIHPQGT